MNGQWSNDGVLDDGAAAVDVRQPGGLQAGHIAGALHLRLGMLGHRVEELPKNLLVVATCGHGERAATALSLLEGAGWAGPLPNLDDGYGAWCEAGYPVALG